MARHALIASHPHRCSSLLSLRMRCSFLHRRLLLLLRLLAPDQRRVSKAHSARPRLRCRCSLSSPLTIHPALWLAADDARAPFSVSQVRTHAPARTHTHTHTHARSGRSRSRSIGAAAARTHARSQSIQPCGLLLTTRVHRSLSLPPSASLFALHPASAFVCASFILLFAH